MSQERFIELESRLSFQEHSIEELNDLVAVQQKQLYDLEEFCKLLLKKINAQPSAGTGATSAAEEKPPHY